MVVSIPWHPVVNIVDDRKKVEFVNTISELTFFRSLCVAGNILCLIKRFHQKQFVEYFILIKKNIFYSSYYSSTYLFCWNNYPSKKCLKNNRRWFKLSVRKFCYQVANTAMNNKKFASTKFCWQDASEAFNLNKWRQRTIVFSYDVSSNMIINKFWV